MNSGRNTLFRANKVANLSKYYYLNNNRYNRIRTENFDRKLFLFNELCNLVGVDDEEKHKAFSKMFTGRVRDYYFDHLGDENLTTENMAASVRRRFITAEIERAVVRL